MDAIFEAIDKHLAERQAYLQKVVANLCAAVQSPIEQKMGLALIAHPLAAMPFISVGSQLPEAKRAGLFIIPQLRIGSYRADLAIVMQSDGYSLRIVVECDGHEFHQKTKEQAAHDKKRDRYFLDHEWPVMRFTGSEIHRDADACADQAMAFLIRGMAKAEGMPSPDKWQLEAVS